MGPRIHKHRQCCLRIYDICVDPDPPDLDPRIWIRGSIPLTNGSGSGCGYGSCYFFVIDIQDANKKQFFLKVFCLLLFEGTFT